MPLSETTGSSTAPPASGPGSFAPRVLGLLLVVVAIRIWVAVALPMISQEAYHWEYATHLDLSYYDHPPLTGWAIALGMHLFGSGTFGIRVASLVFGLGTTLAGLALVRDLGGRERAQILWLVATLAVPILGFGMNLAMTEGPLLFGWMVAMWGFWRAREGHVPWWAVAGAGVAITLLSKYTALFLAPAILLLLVLDPPLRRQLRRPGPWIGGAIALLGLVPVVLWNAEHHWISFVFQATSRYRYADVRATRALSSFAGQLVVLTPVVLAAIVASSVWWLRRLRNDPRALWILGFGLPLPAYMALQSPWSLVKLNWLAPAYLSLTVGAVLCAEVVDASHRWPRFTASLRISAVLGLAFLVASPLFAAFTPWYAGNHWSGWKEVAERAEFWEERIDGRGADEGSVFFFSVGANESAALEYGLQHIQRESTPLEAVFPDSVFGGAGLAFDFWEIPEAMAGKDAVAVIPSNKAPAEGHLMEEFAGHFDSARLVETVEVRSLGVPVQEARIWVCRDYRPDPSP